MKLIDETDAKKKNREKRYEKINQENAGLFKPKSPPV